MNHAEARGRREKRESTFQDLEVEGAARAIRAVESRHVHLLKLCAYRGAPSRALPQMQFSYAGRVDRGEARSSSRQAENKRFTRTDDRRAGVDRYRDGEPLSHGGLLAIVKTQRDTRIKTDAPYKIVRR